jgi:hypothetical protein
VRAKYRVERAFVSCPDSLVKVPLVRFVYVQVG